MVLKRLSNSMDKVKILVTGATGFVGTHLVSSLLDNGYDVHCIVRGESDTTDIDVRSSILRWDESISELMKYFEKENFNGVIHLASLFLSSHKCEDIENLISSNIRFGVYLLEASTKNNINWFINTGTFWQHYNSEDYNPVNLYSATKEAFMKVAKYYTEVCPNLIFSTIKLSDTFGPKDTRRKILNLWLENAKSGSQLEMSNGEQILDISYIKDVISAYILLVRKLSLDDRNKFQLKEYVVTNEEKISLRKLATLFEEVTLLKLNIKWGAQPYRKREVMIPFDKGKLVPGWKQKYSLHDAIKKTIFGDIKLG